MAAATVSVLISYNVITQGTRRQSCYTKNVTVSSSNPGKMSSKPGTCSTSIQLMANYRSKQKYFEASRSAEILTNSGGETLIDYDRSEPRVMFINNLDGRQQFIRIDFSKVKITLGLIMSGLLNSVLCVNRGLTTGRNYEFGFM